MRNRLFFLYGALIYGALIAIALTGVVAAQQTLVYALNVNGGQGTNGQSYDLTMTVAIKSADPDGTRHATITMQSPKVPNMDKSPEDATISPAGAILPKDTTVGKPHAFMTQEQSYALAATAIGAALYAQLRPFNALAETCAQQKSLTAGTTWHAMTQDAQPVDIIYTVKGAAQKAGRNTILVTMHSASTSGPQISGQGYYDPAAHLVVSMHYEGVSPNGKGNESVDIGLVNS